MLALTPGEPGGIGPDLILQRASTISCDDLVVVADADMLAQRAQMLGLNITLHNYPEPANGPGTLTVHHVPLSTRVVPGKLDVANAAGVVDTLKEACDGCLAGEFAGLVTGPVQKSIIIESGITFSGHTEFLRDRAGVPDVVMLLAAGDLRVALATTHLPLADVPGAITRDLLQRRLRILFADLQRNFQLTSPTVLVCGLNPHAGEAGHLGREEIEVITPVLEELQAQGLDVRGPMPADTVFTPDHLTQADAVMAMYHDQGLPVLKHAGFGEAVNITLGLPFVRTSVDHGTALDLAGSGNANGGSLNAAIELARQLTRTA